MQGLGLGSGIYAKMSAARGVIKESQPKQFGKSYIRPDASFASVGLLRSREGCVALYVNLYSPNV